MCIAIFVKPGAEITDEILEISYENNDDGCGFSYVDRENQIIIKKTMHFSEFLSDFREAQAENTHSPFLIHFRIATHGTVDEFNCHPFQIDEETSFIHNGIITGIPLDPIKSDTQMFNECILQELPEGWEFNMAIKPLIEDFIGYSKLVVLKADCTWNIFNEQKGIWNTGKDIWYSNTSYIRRTWGQWQGNKKTTAPVVGRSPQQGAKGKTNTGKATGGNGAKASGSDNQLVTTPITSSNSMFNNLGGGCADLSAWLIEEGDKVECNNCCNYHTLSDMAAYSGPVGDELYCQDCEEAVLLTGYVDPKDEMSIKEYMENYNSLIEAHSTTIGGIN